MSSFFLFILRKLTSPPSRRRSPVAKLVFGSWRFSRSRPEKKPSQIFGDSQGCGSHAPMLAVNRRLALTSIFLASHHALDLTPARDKRWNCIMHVDCLVLLGPCHSMRLQCHSAWYIPTYVHLQYQSMTCFLRTATSCCACLDQGTLKIFPYYMNGESFPIGFLLIDV